MNILWHYNGVDLSGDRWICLLHIFHILSGKRRPSRDGVFCAQNLCHVSNANPEVLADFGIFYDNDSFYSTSKSSEVNNGSSKNCKSVISKPRAIMMTVLSVTVLFRPFMIHCMLPCWIPDFCSSRYCVIPFSANKPTILFATASFTVKMALLM